LSSRPRFGLGDTSRDVSLLFGTTEQQGEYIKGFVILGSILVGMYALWFLALLILCCLGRRRVGFWSGRPFFVKLSPQEYDDVFSEDTDDNVSLNFEGESIVHRPKSPKTLRKTPRPGSVFPKRPTIVRCIFLLLGTIFILFSILLTTQGLSNLSSTVWTVQQSAADIHVIATDVENLLVNTLDRVSKIAEETRTNVVAELQSGPENFCPAAPDLVTSNDVVADIYNKGQSAVELLDQLQTYQQPSLVNSVQDIKKNSATVEDKADGFDTRDWRFVIFMVIVTAIPSVFMAATIMALYDVSFPGLLCAINFLLLPLFVLICLLMVIVSCGILFVSGMNGDFCLPGGFQDNEIDRDIQSLTSAQTSQYIDNSPDLTVLRVLNRQGYQSNDLTFQVAVFYIQQCVYGADPFQTVKGYLSQLKDNEGTLKQFLEVLSGSGAMENLGLLCGRDYAPLRDTVSSLKDLIVVLVKAAVEAVRIIDCSNITPIYTKLVYDGTCEYSVRAMAWVLAASLVMSTSGFLMIMLRASYKLNQYELDAEAAPSIPKEGDEQRGGFEDQLYDGRTYYNENNISADDMNIHEVKPTDNDYVNNGYSFAPSRSEASNMENYRYD
jgi:hypothetical protein